MKRANCLPMLHAAEQHMLRVVGHIAHERVPVGTFSGESGEVPNADDCRRICLGRQMADWQ